MEYRPSIETRFMNAASRIVGEGWGVAVVDELSAHIALRPGMTVRPFQSKLRFSLVAATLKTKTLSRPTRRFIKAFSDRVRTQLAEMHAASTS
ncbi:DNA-binding transcriptional regulator LysR [compost metagenome]